MKDKINSLIVECLGELYMIPRTALKQEQQKRELLAGLIETTITYIDDASYFNRDMDARKYAVRDMGNSIELIEKTLNRKWFEIVKYLEGDD